MLLNLFPELIGLKATDNIAEKIRERLRTLPDRHAAKAPPGKEEQWRRVAENQIAEQLAMSDDELLKWKAEITFRGTKDN